MDRNGIELWRQLNLQYAPKTKGRAFSILGAYMNYPSFDKSRSLLEHIQLLERVRTEYRKASGVELADDIQLSVLVRCLPKHIQQHVQLQLKEDSTYNDVRSAVLGLRERDPELVREEDLHRVGRGAELCSFKWRPCTHGNRRGDLEREREVQGQGQEC